MVPLINYVISLAHRLFCRQGKISPAYSYLTRIFNAAYKAACAPQRARSEAHRFGVALLTKGVTISSEARLESLRFRVSQRHNIVY